MSRPKKKPTIEAQLGDLITQAVEERQFELSKKLISLLDDCLALDRNLTQKEKPDPYPFIEPPPKTLGEKKNAV